MNSTELAKQINYKHYNLLCKIRWAIELFGHGNFEKTTYFDAHGIVRPCYIINHEGLRQLKQLMPNKIILDEPIKEEPKQEVKKPNYEIKTDKFNRLYTLVVNPKNPKVRTIIYGTSPKLIDKNVEKTFKSWE